LKNPHQGCCRDRDQTRHCQEGSPGRTSQTRKIQCCRRGCKPRGRRNLPGEMGQSAGDGSGNFSLTPQRKKIIPQSRATTTNTIKFKPDNRLSTTIERSVHRTCDVIHVQILTSSIAVKIRELDTRNGSANTSCDDALRIPNNFGSLERKNQPYSSL
jgi:hypothetical protein